MTGTHSYDSPKRQEWLAPIYKEELECQEKCTDGGKEDRASGGELGKPALSHNEDKSQANWGQLSCSLPQWILNGGPKPSNRKSTSGDHNQDGEAGGQKLTNPCYRRQGGSWQTYILFQSFQVTLKHSTPNSIHVLCLRQDNLCGVLQKWSNYVIVVWLWHYILVWLVNLDCKIHFFNQEGMLILTSYWSV